MTYYVVQCILEFDVSVLLVIYVIQQHHHSEKSTAYIILPIIGPTYVCIRTMCSLTKSSAAVGVCES